ncbi:lytic murein transglycosylase B [Oleiphilus sp. HI0009]|nr:lytic murein transglycosylase B [Oleiphilus sp. HI0067]KZX78321.1 lytic murein transglycosylase B [Oleiphilus sp. HI0009]KZX79017.1 lytic murein transglycosylase B [Oleiphilus sp. HI0009]KZY69663.1 lytic murein transglycosylase B [Oleiphilus sp. HI0067]
MNYLVFTFALLFAPILAFADYSQHENAQSFIDMMVKEHGFSESDIRSALTEASRKESILKAISRPAEKTLNWAKYSKIFLTESRIKQGREFLEEYAEPLKRAEDEFGVPKEIITAIIGVETKYGRNKGSYRVIDALATLGFDYPPRSKFFSSELKEMFLLAREQSFKVTDLKGSYAGAMGYGQFISSSYRHYAVDFDGDGVVDILNNPIDAIGSVANYFKRHKWKSDQPVAKQVSLNGVDYEGLLHDKLKPKYVMKDLRDAGYSADSDISNEEAIKLLDLVAVGGDETWLTFHNFYVITRYNHSHLYAMAVFQLAESF